MSPAIVAAVASGELPTRSIPVTEAERAGLREVFQSWGRDPAELDWRNHPTTSLADLAASVLPALTRNRALSTLMLVTATPDAKPTTQPSVAVLREHIEHDHAIDLPAAWSITEQGMLAPLTALRIGSRRVRRLTGDVVVIAADRTGLPHPAKLSAYQKVVASRALGVVLSGSADEVWVGLGVQEKFSELLAQAVAASPRPDYLVVAGDISSQRHQELTALDRPIAWVDPGQPAVGLLAEASRLGGRVLLVIADPDQGQVGFGSFHFGCF